MTRNYKYNIRDRETGNIAETVKTHRKAKSILASYEQEDKRNGVFTRDFYEIRKVRQR